MKGDSHRGNFTGEIGLGIISGEINNGVVGESGNKSREGN